MQANYQLAITNNDKKGAIYVTWLLKQDQDQVMIDPYLIPYPGIEAKASPANNQNYVIQIANHEQPPQLFTRDYRSDANRAWVFNGAGIQ